MANSRRVPAKRADVKDEYTAPVHYHIMIRTREQILKV